MSLLDMISKEKIKQKVTDVDIAKELNVTKGAVSQYFTGKARISFFSFLKLIQFVYKGDIEKQKQMLNSFCNLTDRPENLRLTMEYASSNCEYDLLGFLVKKEEDSHNKTNEEWAHVYEVLYKRSKGVISNKEFRLVIMEMSQKVKCLEMKILTKIAIMYMFYDLKEYSSLIKLTDDILEQINKIKNPYIKSSFRLRAIEMIVVSNFMNNNVIKAREYEKWIDNNNEISEHSPLISASIFHWLGQTYISENPYKAISYVEHGKDVLEESNGFNFKNRIHMFQDTIDFIKIFSEIEIDKIKPRSLSELAHLLCKQGNKNEALNILNKMKMDKGELSEYQIYYLYLCTGEKRLLEEAIKKLEDHGNLYYANLIKNVAISV